MPELPDVEGFRRVAAEASGLCVREVRVNDASVLHDVSPEEFSTALSGKYVGSAKRHGKWLEMPTRSSAEGEDSLPEVLLHFGMTGSLRWDRLADAEHPHDRVVFVFDSHELRYRDMRKLTGMHVARRRADVALLLGDLGPDALSITRDRLAERLGTSHKRLKSALMDQSMLAGLGNLTVDEVLWRARVHPRRAVATLSRAELTQLHRAVRGVLVPAARAGQVPVDAAWLTSQRDVADGICPRCRTRLARGRISGRSSLWCPHCQSE